MEQGDYNQSMPIYLQILQGIRQKIASGEWPPGTRVPPVRELSVQLGVNPNTAQRSLTELEREGLVYAERTAGRFITGDTERIRALRARMAEEYARQYHRQMLALGCAPEEMADYLRRAATIEEGRENS